MKVRRVRRYDRERGCYVYDIGFSEDTVDSERTARIGEVFGVEEQISVLYDDFELKISEGDVVCITGDSGSGKSVLLDAIRKDLGQEAVDISELPDPENVAIVDAVGSSFKDALELLSKVGLNDAPVFLRKYCELSAGQRYRFKLAQMIDTDARFWVCDEFCSLLDRTTAKVVAYNVQKQARRAEATLLVATSHIDIVPDVNPDVRVVKGWGDNVMVSYEEALPLSCSVMDEVTIEEGEKGDYDQLKEHHYRWGRLTFPMKYYRVLHRGELAGVIVYKYPLARVQGRKQAVGYWPSVEELNNEWASIARIIIHPKYRGIGLGSKLIKETLEQVDRRHVELVAVMALYNPFAEKAGMRLVQKTEAYPGPLKALQNLHDLGLDTSRMGSKRYNVEKLDTKDLDQIVKAFVPINGKNTIRKLTRSNKPRNREDFQAWLREQDNESLAWCIQSLSILAQSKAYLYWSTGGEGGIENN